MPWFKNLRKEKVLRKEIGDLLLKVNEQQRQLDLVKANKEACEAVLWAIAWESEGGRTTCKKENVKFCKTTKTHLQISEIPSAGLYELTATCIEEQDTEDE